MSEVTLVKRLIILGVIAVVVMGIVACTREKPFESSTPVIAQGVTPVPVPSGAATVSGTLVPGPTETPAPTVTLVVPLPSLVVPTLSVVTPVPGVYPSTGTATTYTVQWGDWLRKIAEKNGVTVEAIIAANPGINPNVIYPGQVLKIPAPSGSVVTPSTGLITPAVPSGGPTTYTVQQGEWFYQIARKFGVSVAQLQAANPGVNPNFLYPGQVLNIPGGVVSNPTPSSATTPTPASSTTPTLGSGSGTTYTVQAGDTLYAIAVRFHTTPYALQIANHLPNANAIYPGMVLIIPPQ
jgi:LysM repeat protein